MDFNIYDESQVDETHIEELAEETNRKRSGNNPTNPIPTEKLSHELQTKLANPREPYNPRFSVPYDEMKPKVSRRDPLQLFLYFFTEQCIATIVASTNIKATAEGRDTQHPRPWKPLMRNELLQWIGLLFYMGRHNEMRRTDYWSSSARKPLGQWMGRERWEQIHRFLCITTRHSLQAGQPPPKPWFSKLLLVANWIRAACQAAVIPPSRCTVDEAMAAFQGRSSHKVKIKGKPIEEGFKLWVLAFGKGYVFN